MKFHPIDDSFLSHYKKDPIDCHKYEKGAVIGFGGEMMGAAYLSSLGALHGGAGYVKLYSLHASIAPPPLEVIVEPACDTLDLTKAKALFIGPGLGRSKEAEKLLFSVLEKRGKLPLVLDGDALFFKAKVPNAILTPHTGELAYLGLQKDNFASFQSFATEHNLVLLVKGRPTYLFSPSHPPLKMDRGDPILAIAGSGDVLTGQIAALLARGHAPQEAAALGALLHARAGERLGQEKGVALASEIAFNLSLDPVHKGI